MSVSSSSSKPVMIQSLAVPELLSILTFLSTEDTYLASRVCRAWNHHIKACQPIHNAGCMALGTRELAAYRSQEPELVEGRVTAQERIDNRINVIKQRLRNIQQNQPADAAPNPEPIALQKTLDHLSAPVPTSAQFSENVLALIGEYGDSTSSLRSVPRQQPLTAIGTADWNRFIGKTEPHSFPLDTKKRLCQPCSVFPGKTLGDQHIVVDIPPLIDGQPLTLKRLIHYAQHPQNGGKAIKLNVCWDKILEVLGDKPIQPGQYFLLKTCLPGTKGKTHPQQLEVLNRLKKTNPEYCEAALIEVVVPALMEYIRSGDNDIRLFLNEYARTSTIVGNWRLAFGGFGSGWPNVVHDRDDKAYDHIGLAVVLRPGGSSPVLGP